MEHILNQGIVYRGRDTLFSYQGWPSICRDEQGTLYAVSSGMRLGHICPFGKTVMYISRNAGKTWTPPIVLHDDYIDDRDAGITYLGRGRMVVTWFYHPTEHYRTNFMPHMQKHLSAQELIAAQGVIATYDQIPDDLAHGGSFLRISGDYGVTWSDPIRIPVSSPYGPVLLRDGSLLYLGKEMYIPGVAPGTHENICAYRSTDCGQTWQYLSTIEIPEGLRPGNFHEPHAVELPDGTLLGAIRAQGKGVDHGFTIYTTTSTDGGLSWSALTPTGICGSPPHLLLHSSGALIMAYGRRAAPYSERAAISYDGGQSWQETVLDDRPIDPDLGYPATVELDDGSLLTVYYQKYAEDKKCSLLYTHWRLP